METVFLSHPLDVSQTYPPTVLCIGYFDGLHLGHRRVIQKGIDIGNRREYAKSVMTFDPHPREVLGKSERIRHLTPLEDKLRLLEKAGVDRTYVVHFDIAFSSIYPEDFVEEYLIPLQVRHAVVGFDYTFGYRGSGTAETLKELSRGRFDVDVVGPVNRYGEKIGSTVIRDYLHQGEITHANMLLGRPFYFEGKVVHGEKRGREIGFPTANLKLEKRYFIPKTGVYGVRVHIDGKPHFGVMNIGIKPTFEEGKKEKSIEVHVLDFAQPLYERTLGVEVLFYLRSEQKFSSVRQLTDQIERDVEAARKRFSQEA